MTRRGWRWPPIRAGLGRFLWLWLVPLLIFLTGLHRAWLTGQADPWDWALPMALVLALAGAVLARRGWLMMGWLAIGWAAMGGVGMATIFCMLASGRAPQGWAVAGLWAVAMLAAFGGALLRRPPFASRPVENPVRDASRSGLKRTGLGVALLAIAVLILWRGPAQSIQPSPERPGPDLPGLAIVTALPLFWDEAGRDGPRDAPIVKLLRSRFMVTPLDDPQRLAASGVKRLLLAQPRALTPPQLVAIDMWVRAGGTALVLADPLLRWPSGLPLGDRRRAPSASLLQPLLGHWGFRPSDLKSEEMRYHAPDGHLITLSGVRAYLAGRDDRWVGPGDWIVHRKRIGKGEVLLLGDADPIDDRLWLADPARPLNPRYWIADTPALVIDWLGGAPVPGERRWMREAADVRHGLRWAVWAGIIWAILGAALFRREIGGAAPGTKRERMTIVDRKSG
ncbi:Gldg family protein [Sphingobium sp.]|uniref:Gldg family protein n=1 Tax=Sphingobium sp. TaxID=1912891 RepID=UPI003B3B3EDE